MSRELTAEQRAQLREVAERATGAHDRLSVMPADDIFDISLHEGTQLDADITALNTFNEAFNPAVALALLDELERKDKRITELEEQLRREQDYHLSVDMERMELWKKLESRTVTVKLPPVSFFDFNKCSGFANGAYVNLEAMNKALADAGINLTVEG